MQGFWNFWRRDMPEIRRRQFHVLYKQKMNIRLLDSYEWAEPDFSGSAFIYITIYN